MCDTIHLLSHPECGYESADDASITDIIYRYGLKRKRTESNNSWRQTVTPGIRQVAHSRNYLDSHPNVVAPICYDRLPKTRPFKSHRLYDTIGRHPRSMLSPRKPWCTKPTWPLNDQNFRNCNSAVYARAVRDQPHKNLVRCVSARSHVENHKVNYDMFDSRSRRFDLACNDASNLTGFTAQTCRFRNVRRPNIMTPSLDCYRRRYYSADSYSLDPNMPWWRKLYTSAYGTFDSSSTIPFKKSYLKKNDDFFNPFSRSKSWCERCAVGCWDYQKRERCRPGIATNMRQVKLKPATSKGSKGEHGNTGQAKQSPHKCYIGQDNEKQSIAYPNKPIPSKASHDTSDRRSTNSKIVTPDTVVKSAPVFKRSLDSSHGSTEKASITRTKQSFIKPKKTSSGEQGMQDCASEKFKNSPPDKLPGPEVQFKAWTRAKRGFKVSNTKRGLTSPCTILTLYEGGAVSDATDIFRRTRRCGILSSGPSRAQSPHLMRQKYRTRSSSWSGRFTTTFFESAERSNSTLPQFNPEASEGHVKAVTPLAHSFFEGKNDKEPSTRETMTRASHKSNLVSPLSKRTTRTKSSHSASSSPLRHTMLSEKVPLEVMSAYPIERENLLALPSTMTFSPDMAMEFETVAMTCVDTGKTSVKKESSFGLWYYIKKLLQCFRESKRKKDWYFFANWLKCFLENKRERGCLPPPCKSKRSKSLSPCARRRPCKNNRQMRGSPLKYTHISDSDFVVVSEGSGPCTGKSYVVRSIQKPSKVDISPKQREDKKKTTKHIKQEVRRTKSQSPPKPQADRFETIYTDSRCKRPDCNRKIDVHVGRTHTSPNIFCMKSSSLGKERNQKEATGDVSKTYEQKEGRIFVIQDRKSVWDLSGRKIDIKEPRTKQTPCADDRSQENHDMKISTSIFGTEITAETEGDVVNILLSPKPKTLDEYITRDLPVWIRTYDVSLQHLSDIKKDIMNDNNMNKKVETKAGLSTTDNAEPHASYTRREDCIRYTNDIGNIAVAKHKTFEHTDAKQQQEKTSDYLQTRFIFEQGKNLTVESQYNPTQTTTEDQKNLWSGEQGQRSTDQKSPSHPHSYLDRQSNNRNDEGREIKPVATGTKESPQSHSKDGVPSGQSPTPSLPLEKLSVTIISSQIESTKDVAPKCQREDIAVSPQTLSVALNWLKVQESSVASVVTIIVGKEGETPLQHLENVLDLDENRTQIACGQKWCHFYGAPIACAHDAREICSGDTKRVHGDEHLNSSHIDSKTHSKHKETNSSHNVYCNPQHIDHNVHNASLTCCNSHSELSNSKQSYTKRQGGGEGKTIHGARQAHQNTSGSASEYSRFEEGQRMKGTISSGEREITVAGRLRQKESVSASGTRPNETKKISFEVRSEKGVYKAGKNPVISHEDSRANNNAERGPSEQSEWKSKINSATSLGREQRVGSGEKKVSFSAAYQEPRLRTSAASPATGQEAGCYEATKITVVINSKRSRGVKSDSLSIREGSRYSPCRGSSAGTASFEVRSSGCSSDDGHIVGKKDSSSSVDHANFEQKRRDESLRHKPSSTGVDPFDFWENYDRRKGLIRQKRIYGSPVDPAPPCYMDNDDEKFVPKCGSKEQGENISEIQQKPEKDSINLATCPLRKKRPSQRRRSNRFVKEKKKSLKPIRGSYTPRRSARGTITKIPKRSDFSDPESEKSESVPRSSQITETYGTAYSPFESTKAKKPIKKKGSRSRHKAHDQNDTYLGPLVAWRHMRDNKPSAAPRKRRQKKVQPTGPGSELNVVSPEGEHMRQIHRGSEAVSNRRSTVTSNEHSRRKSALLTLFNDSRRASRNCATILDPTMNPEGKTMRELDRTLANRCSIRSSDTDTHPKRRLSIKPTLGTASNPEIPTDQSSALIFMTAPSHDDTSFTPLQELRALVAQRKADQEEAAYARQFDTFQSSMFNFRQTSQTFTERQAEHGDKTVRDASTQTAEWAKVSTQNRKYVSRKTEPSETLRSLYQCPTKLKMNTSNMVKKRRQQFSRNLMVETEEKKRQRENQYLNKLLDGTLPFAVEKVLRTHNTNRPISKRDAILGKSQL